MTLATSKSTLIAGPKRRPINAVALLIFSLALSQLCTASLSGDNFGAVRRRRWQSDLPRVELAKDDYNDDDDVGPQLNGPAANYLSDYLERRSQRPQGQLSAASEDDNDVGDFVYGSALLAPPPRSHSYYSLDSLEVSPQTNTQNSNNGIKDSLAAVDVDEFDDGDVDDFVEFRETLAPLRATAEPSAKKSTEPSIEQQLDTSKYLAEHNNSLRQSPDKKQLVDKRQATAAVGSQIASYATLAKNMALDFGSALRHYFGLDPSLAEKAKAGDVNETLNDKSGEHSDVSKRRLQQWAPLMAGHADIDSVGREDDADKADIDMADVYRLQAQQRKQPPVVYNMLQSASAPTQRDHSDIDLALAEQTIKRLQEHKLAAASRQPIEASGDSLLGRYLYAPISHFHFGPQLSAQSRPLADADAEAEPAVKRLVGSGGLSKGHGGVAQSHQRPQLRTHIIELSSKPNDAHFVMLVMALCATASTVVIAAGLFAYKLQLSRRKLAKDDEPPSYGVVGPNSVAILGGHNGGGGGGGGHLATNYVIAASNGGGVVLPLDGCKLTNSKPMLSVQDQNIQQAPATEKKVDCSLKANQPAAYLGSQNAAMYHYQHQKQAMLSKGAATAAAGQAAAELDLDDDDDNVSEASNESDGELDRESARRTTSGQQATNIARGSGSGRKAGSKTTKNQENSDDDDEHNYTVYECPGLASAHNMEIKNPLFSHDDTTTPIGSPSALWSAAKPRRN